LATGKWIKVADELQISGTVRKHIQIFMKTV
jgi:hypothetical protein